MAEYQLKEFPRSRIATNDVCAVGLQKHHVAAFIEIDVSNARDRIKQLKKEKVRISFTAWLIKVSSLTIKDYEDIAAFLRGKRKVVVFNDINVSLVVEKELNGQRIPIPLVIEKAHEKSIESITQEINNARSQKLTERDIVLQNRSKKMEHLYYILPGFIRRFIWRYLIAHPQVAFSKMGNVAVTSIGMIGNANGWFLPISVHPVCFGIGKIMKKPVVIKDQIEIREMLNMTVLLDHDVADGAQMARFISKLSSNIENCVGLSEF
ncbi:MAG TPA: 2-oxo acid dehydrogenase subunit E2 [Candidatus Cloacimonadota bacterium]|nr:2-oxo acid dehydrogenase subunit E2 [Candidatus Cloacimonadota bacterium]